jgi:hypothetical protein
MFRKNTYKFRSTKRKSTKRRTLKGSGKKEKGQHHITSLAKSTIPFSYATLGYPRIGRTRSAAQERQTKIRSIFTEKRDKEAVEEAKEAAKELLATKRKWFADTKVREKAERGREEAARKYQELLEHNALTEERIRKKEMEIWNANKDKREREEVYGSP